MSFSTKVFLAILFTTVLSCVLIVFLIYFLLKKDIQDEYFNRYNSLGKIIAKTFHQMELTTDTVNTNAAIALSERLKNEKNIPSDPQLDTYAKHLGVMSFYVINSQGRFLRSTDLPIKQQTNSLFSYSKDYANLVHGNLEVAVTPIIPSFPLDIPAKFTMIPNSNKTLILESGIHLEYISQLLHQAVIDDKNISSIGLYAPTGFELGSINAAGEFHQGKRDANTDIFFGRKFEGNEVIFSLKVPASVGYCPECIVKGVSQNGDYFYILKINVSLLPLLARLNVLKDFLLLILLGVTIISIFLSRILAKKLVERIHTISHTTREIMQSGNLDLRVNIEKNSDEISSLAETFNEMIGSLKAIQLKLIAAEKSKALAMIATQVAHDIRSPLLVLTTVLNDLSHLPEKKRIDVRNAIQRVSDIANNLLVQYRLDKQPSDKSTPAEAHEAETLSSEPIAMLLESIVSEKRLQTAELGIDIQLQLSPSAHTAFARVDITSFKRVLSNLMNNAVEAVRDQKNQKGLVTLALDKRDKKVLIDIQDNGPGIPPDKLEKLLNEGGSFGKKEGSGLGLPYAMHKIREWKGNYTLTSEPDAGTTFSLQLPEAPTPPWFQDTIRVMEGGSIVILDDDDYIHHIWEERFPEDFLKAHDLTIHHFNNPPDFIRFCKSHDANHTIFLLDYDLKTYTDTGQSLAEQLHIGPKATLVSSRYEDVDIRAKCLSLGMKIIPKYLAEQTPIRVLPKPTPTDIVFIDDNTAITDIWKESAEDAGKTISVFNDPRDFLAVAESYPKETLIYIDSELNDGLKGEDIAKTLFDQGFQALYLATGHPKDHFTHVTWIKDILGKEPPWG